VCAALNGAANAGAGARGRRFEVAPELAALPVTAAFDAARADPAVVCESLAWLYGLRVRQERAERGGRSEDGAAAATVLTTLRLVRRTVTPTSDPARLHAALRDAFPDPLLRACRADDVPPPGEPAPASALGVAALKRLRTLVEPRLGSAADRADAGGRAVTGLTAAEIGEAARQALAVHILAAALARTGGAGALLDRELPVYVREFDRGVLTGGRYEKEGRARMHLSLSLADPRLKTGMRPTIGVLDAEIDAEGGAAARAIDAEIGGK